MPVHETSRDYAHPYRAALVRAVNLLGRPFAKPLRVDALLERARRKTKLDTLDDPQVLERLAVALDVLEREAALTPFGRLITREHFVSVLVTQLRLHAWKQARPDIFAAAQPRIVFITGLARSGTTHLQRMLAELPGARSLLTWEALEPIPPPSWQPPPAGRPDPRIAKAEQSARGLKTISPDFYVVHPMEADIPEEEVMVMQHSLLSWVLETTYHVPSFTAWVEAQDQRPSYRLLADVVAHLQFQRPGEFWILKAPYHLGSLDALFDVFPHASVVHCHRDPAQTVPSFCSLVAHGWGIASDHIDPLALGRQWSEKLARMTDRALAVRAARHDAKLFDVDYRALVRDPLAVAERLCRDLALPYGPDARSRLEQHVQAHPQHRYGVHRYEPADFGLSEASLHARFAAYMQRFDLG